MGTVLKIKGVGKALSRWENPARNPTQNPTQNPTPNRPEPGRTIQRLRTAPCPQVIRWSEHSSVGKSRARNPTQIPPRNPPQTDSEPAARIKAQAALGFYVVSEQIPSVNAAGTSLYPVDLLDQKSRSTHPSSSPQTARTTRRRRNEAFGVWGA